MHPAVTDSIINYQVQLEIPKGDTIPIPSKDDGWSDPVRGRGGFQLMREADRGRDSYNTEHQLPGSDDWVTGVSYDEIAERYQSKGEAQKLTYSYLPYDPANPRR
ncbi:MAG: hypothetical protein ABIT47_01245 [Candidatus Paceibacterota bacterium]